MQTVGPSDASQQYQPPSMGGAGEAAQPSGPALPEEPEQPASLAEAELWLRTYDRYVRKVTELAREENVEDELQPWIERCTRRRRYWERARDRLRRVERREGVR